MLWALDDTLMFNNLFIASRISEPDELTKSKNSLRHLKRILHVGYRIERK